MSVYEIYVNLYDKFLSQKFFEGRVKTAHYNLENIRLVANLLDFPRLVALRSGFTGSNNEQILYVDFDIEISFPIHFQASINNA